MTKINPLYLKQKLSEYDERLKKSTLELNKVSELFRDEKKSTFLDLAKYSGATLGIMFTFLGVLIGLDGVLSWCAKLFFFLSGILFTLCIVVSLAIRTSSNLYLFYSRKIFYLNDRNVSLSVQSTIIDQHPEQVTVIGKDSIDASNIMIKQKEDLNNTSIGISKELKKCEKLSKIYEKIFKYGAYIDYGLFASGYIALMLFVYIVLTTI